MSNRVKTLKDSACYSCEFKQECMERIRRSPQLMEICDVMLNNSGLKVKDCGIWIACAVDNAMKVGGQNS